MALTSKKAFDRFAEQFIFLYWPLQLMALIGSIMFLLGGTAWYNKVQRYEDIIQEVAGLKAKKELEELTNKKE